MQCVQAMQGRLSLHGLFAAINAEPTARQSDGRTGSPATAIVLILSGPQRQRSFPLTRHVEIAFGMGKVAQFEELTDCSEGSPMI